MVGDIAVVPGEVRLAVERAEERSSIGDVPAASGEMFAVVRLALANGLNVAMVAAPAAFRVRTGDGLERMAAPASALLTDACPANAFLGPGQRLTCTVAFAANRRAEPTALIYAGAAESTEPNSARVLRVEAPIRDFQHCARCNDLCVDLGSSERHCGQCGVAVPVGGRCADGVPACPSGQTTCDGECVDLLTDARHCGRCGAATPDLASVSCVDGRGTCSGRRTLCGNQCADTNSDDANCGGCGQACPEIASCGPGYPSVPGDAGKCILREFLPSGQRCDAQCASRGGRCLSAGNYFADNESAAKCSSLRADSCTCIFSTL